MKRALIAGCAVVLTACVAPRYQAGLSGQAAGPETKEERAAQKEANSAAVAKVKEVSQTYQSAIALAEQGNSLCFPSGSARYAGAHSAYREALKLEPKNTYVLAAEATCYARQGMEEKFSGKAGEASTDKRHLRLADKWFNRALGASRQALKVNQNYGTAHLIIAEVYAMSGRADKALETLNQIEQLKLIPEGRESGFYAWRAYTKHLLGQPFDKDAEAAAEYFDPVEFAEFVDRLQHPEDYKDVPPGGVPVVPYP